MTNILNLEALQNASLNSQPYPYFTVERSISDAAVNAVIADFPKIHDGGSYNLDDVKIGPEFDKFLK